MSQEKDSKSIDKKTLEYLAGLARIQLESQEEERLVKDLQTILAYFEELKGLDTQNVSPMNGGTGLKNIFREDLERENTWIGQGPTAFPESKDGFLKVPRVFEE